MVTALYIDHRALNQVEIGSPQLLSIRTLLSKIVFDLVTSRSRGKDVRKGSFDLLRVSAPGVLGALDSFPGHLFQFAGIEENAQELDKPAQLCPHPPARPH